MFNVSCSGFSFLESIISVFILSFGIVAVMPLISSSLNDSHDSRDQIIAAFLAQEGVELVINERDNNWAKGEGEKAFKGQSNFPSDSEEECRIDYKSSAGITNADCGSSLNKWLYLNSNYYDHNDSVSANKSKFQRKISIQYKKSDGTNVSGGRDDSEAAMVEVTSTVVWKRTDFPEDEVPPKACNTSSQCSEVSVTLTTWH